MKKRLLPLIVALLSSGASWAQLSKEEAQLAVGLARAAVIFPVRAEICGWTNANTTWDTLRLLAAAHYLFNSEYRSKLNSDQIYYAAQLATADESLLVSIAKRALENKPCTDNSVPKNKAEWERYVVQLNEFGDREIERLKGESGEKDRSRK
jgi:hypothetical protein